MQFKIIIYIFLLTLFTIQNNNADPISYNRVEREVSSNIEDDWLKDLESQIISNPDDLKAFLSGTDSNPDVPEGNGMDLINNEGTFDHDKNTESTKEPIVVTEKPYLTGDEIISVQEEFDSTSEDVTKTTQNFQSPENKKGVPSLPSSYGNSNRVNNDQGSHDQQQHSIPQSPLISEENNGTKYNTESEAKLIDPYTNDIIIVGSTSLPDPLVTFTDDIRKKYRASTTISSIFNIEDKESKRVLDTILANKPNRMKTRVNLDNSRSNHEIFKDGSEVKTFVVFVKNQTHFIIFGCILSIIVLIALVLSVYQILQKLNERSNIILIAHYEQQDVNEQGVFQKV